MRRRYLISGPVLLGFAELFDAASGDPETPKPYATVTPASVGGVLLPFPCPRCGAVRAVAVHPKKRRDYLDERGFSWCPACGYRYHLNTAGVPLAAALPAGAASAPASVTGASAITRPSGIPRDATAWDETGWWTRRKIVPYGEPMPSDDGLALLGADCG